MRVRTLKAHCRPGEDVKRAQVLLRGLGYLPKSHKAGRSYGIPTRSAVKRFKKDHGLPHDSILGENGWKALEKAYALKHKRPVPKVAMVKPAPLSERAYNVAKTLIGVMEQGGNNAGPMVSKIIHENDGSGPEPWCGDFMAYVYRHAGSKVVQRAWAAVRFLGFLTGQQIVKEPKRGDIVCYEFDHTGMFVRWVNKATGEFEAIEGNTTATGAVSDSSTGGDGVYLKRRNRSQVSRWVHVIR